MRVHVSCTRGELINVLWHLTSWNIFMNILILHDLKTEIL